MFSNSSFSLLQENDCVFNYYVQRVLYLVCVLWSLILFCRIEFL